MTWTRADISSSVARSADLSQARSGALVDGIIEHMRTALCQGEHVKIPRFGSLVLYDVPERIAHDFRKGTSVPLAPRRVVKFRPAATLRESLTTSGGSGV